jgi:hypothetical protein
MRNRTSAALLIVATAILGGCGSSSDSPEKAPATPQAVVDQYRAAIIGGDGETACSLLADDALKDVEQDGSSCAPRLGAIADQDTPEDTAALKAMHPTAVVSGSQAVAKLKTIGGDPTKIVLAKGADGWRVTDSPELENVRIANG